MMYSDTFTTMSSCPQKGMYNVALIQLEGYVVYISDVIGLGSTQNK